MHNLLYGLSNCNQEPKYKIIERSKNFEDLDNNNVKAFLESFITDIFGVNFNDLSKETNNFLNSNMIYQFKNKDSQEVNIYKYDSDGISFDIEIGTVHSVKGETHTATLYLETFHNGLESDKILPYIKGIGYLPIAKKTEQIKALKMIYVGCTRPTDLLCIAINKDNKKLKVSDIDELKTNWEILDLTII